MLDYFIVSARILAPGCLFHVRYQFGLASGKLTKLEWRNQLFLCAMDSSSQSVNVCQRHSLFGLVTCLIHHRTHHKINPAWWLTYPSEKYESQLGLLFPIYGNIYKTCSKPPTRTHGPWPLAPVSPASVGTRSCPDQRCHSRPKSTCSPGPTASVTCHPCVPGSCQ